jgi:hypothetical protein
MIVTTLRHDSHPHGASRSLDPRSVQHGKEASPAVGTVIGPHFDKPSRAAEPDHAYADAQVYPLHQCFSKNAENLKAAVSLHFAHYNFVRLHSSLRVTSAKGDHTKISPFLTLFPTV